MPACPRCSPPSGQGPEAIVRQLSRRLVELLPMRCRRRWVLAAAAIHGGTEPGLPEEAASWQADDLWQYAMYVAGRLHPRRRQPGVPVRQVCQDLDERPGYLAL